MVYLPEQDKEWIDLVESVSNMFIKYTNIKKKLGYLPELKNKDPKKFLKFKKLIGNLIENIAYIENNLAKIKGVINRAPEKKRRGLLESLDILSKAFSDLIDIQKKISR